MPVDVDAEVVSNAQLTPDYNVLTLAAPDVARLAKPGQFVMVRPGASGDPLLRRPFSIFEIVRDERGTPIALTLLNKRAGIGTSMLFRARPGDRISCLGPLGKPFVPVDPPAEAWMIAGGVGLAPFVTLAEALAAKGTPMTLFYGGRSASDLFHETAFEQLGARLVLTTEDGSRGETGRVTLPLERALVEAGRVSAPVDRASAPTVVDPANGLTLADTPRQITLYACGPTPMMRAVAALGDRHGRPVFVSLEPVMGCGMGGCYSCVVRVRHDDAAPHFVRSCLEGPVFDARTVIWQELVH